MKEIIELVELFIVTGIAAFVGVWAAVALENKKKEEVRVHQLLKEYSFAALHLKVQEGVLLTIKANLEEYRNDPNRHLTMLPVSMATELEFLQPRDFAFLLLDNNDLAVNLSTNQNYLSQFFADFQNRNNKHYEFQSDQKNPILIKQLKDATDNLYSDLKEMEVSHSQFIKELNEYGEVKFKNVKAQVVELGTFDEYMGK